MSTKVSPPLYGLSSPSRDRVSELHEKIIDAELNIHRALQQKRNAEQELVEQFVKDNSPSFLKLDRAALARYVRSQK